MNSNWSYSPETPNLGQIRRFLEPCVLEIWRMTLKNNRTPLLSNIKLYASFHHHIWIQTRVTVRKQLSWVMTSVTLTFNLRPWSFAWTSSLLLVITPENFVRMRWQEHSQKGVTDRRTDRQTDRRTERSVLRAAWSQLKLKEKLGSRYGMQQQTHLPQTYSRKRLHLLYQTTKLPNRVNIFCLLLWHSIRRCVSTTTLLNI